MFKFLLAIAVCTTTFSSFAFAASCQEQCANNCRGKGGLCFNHCSASCAQSGKPGGKGGY